MFFFSILIMGREFEINLDNKFISKSQKTTENLIVNLI